MAPVRDGASHSLRMPHHGPAPPTSPRVRPGSTDGPTEPARVRCTRPTDPSVSASSSTPGPPGERDCTYHDSMPWLPRVCEARNPPRAMPPDIMLCPPECPRLNPFRAGDMDAVLGRTAQESARRRRDRVEHPLSNGTTHSTIGAMRSTITDRRHRPLHAPDRAPPMAPLSLRAPGAPGRRVSAS